MGFSLCLEDACKALRSPDVCVCKRKESVLKLPTWIQICKVSPLLHEKPVWGLKKNHHYLPDVFTKDFDVHSFISCDKNRDTINIWLDGHPCYQLWEVGQKWTKYRLGLGTSTLPLLEHREMRNLVRNPLDPDERQRLSVPVPTPAAVLHAGHWELQLSCGPRSSTGGGSQQLGVVCCAQALWNTTEMPWPLHLLQLQNPKMAYLSC